MAINVFVAGSKELKQKRDICRSVCSSLQNQWGTIYTKTFEDFPEVISNIGHQKEYNLYIENKADLVIFVFSDKAGSETVSEFNHAYKAFKKNKSPKILVYFEKTKKEDPEDIKELKEHLKNREQYYLEYTDDKELENKLERHIVKFLKSLLDPHPMPASKPVPDSILRTLGVSASFIAVWFAMLIIGGVGMYIYDRNMSDAKCLKLATKYVCDNMYGDLEYSFPDATYYYNTKNNELKIVKKSNPMTNIDIGWENIKNVTFGATASLVIARFIPMVKLKGNPKQVIGFIAAATAGAIGIGVGCVVEQMLFPPQISKSVRDYLSVEDNWEKVVREVR